MGIGINMDSKPRIIAFYLPQFHPIPENDEWWGKGFTEWTNVGKAKPLFPGHYQPRVPADLGYYDLRVPEVREEQARLAREAGIEGFCYWHYWFGNGKQLLEKPLGEVVKSGKPDFPFCLGWANESWYAKLWDKDVRKDKLLIEQKYGGREDYELHFYSVLKILKDSRYIRVNDKPVFMIYKPLASSEIPIFMKTWDVLAKKEGLLGIYWIGQCVNDTRNLQKYKMMGFDAINILAMNSYGKNKNIISRAIKKLCRMVLRRPYVADYSKVVEKIHDGTEFDPIICPTILTGWDHTPRSGKNGTVLVGYNPHTLKKHIHDTILQIEHKQNGIIFLKSWNEWGEGNYLEPDLKWGHAFLDVLREEINKSTVF